MKIVKLMGDNESCFCKTKVFQIKQIIRIKENKQRYVFILSDLHKWTSESQTFFCEKR